jgi:hypothetical protein
MSNLLSPAHRVKSKPEHTHLLCDCGNGLVTLNITTLDCSRTRSDFYFLERLPCADVAFRLRKVDPACDGTDKECGHYDVNVTAQSCECRGHLRWNVACKHLETLSQLVAEGRLS